MIFMHHPQRQIFSGWRIEATVGEGLLNEDLGADEVYVRLKLSNLWLPFIAGNSNISPAVSTAGEIYLVAAASAFSK